MSTHPDVVCLNDQCPEYHRAKANPDGYDPAIIVCGGCGQPVNITTSQPPLLLNVNQEDTP